MITVRRAAAADGDAILALTTWLSTAFVVEAAAFRASFEDVLGRPDMCVLIAESSGGVIGYLLGFDHPAFRANGRVAWVDELGVAEAAPEVGRGASADAGVRGVGARAEERTRRAGDGAGRVVLRSDRLRGVGGVLPEDVVSGQWTVDSG